MTDQTRDMHNKRRVCVHSGETCTETAHIEALTKRVEELEEALRRIAEGNLGSMPWQADYAKIREVASAALSNAARGEEI